MENKQEDIGSENIIFKIILEEKFRKTKYNWKE